MDAQEDQCRRRIDELLEANNRYLERARSAEAVAAYYKHHMRRWKAVAGRAIENDGKHSHELWRANMRINELTDPKRGAFTFLEMEAALCVWEWIIEQTNPGNQPETEASIHAAAWREAIGTVEARHASYEIGRYCLRVYEKGKEIGGPDAWDAVPYDWEVIPAICETIGFDAATGAWIEQGLDAAARYALERAADWRGDAATGASLKFPVWPK